MEQDVVNAALQLGVKHFQAQNYEKALKVFTKAIDLAQSYEEPASTATRHAGAHPKLVTLLDSRAATYEKLKRFRQAGKDGEDIIEVDPLSCKGYLRVCKILLILDAKIDAYKVLSKGHKRIDAAIASGQLKETPLFRQIVAKKQQLAQELKRKPVPKKRPLSETAAEPVEGAVQKSKRPKSAQLDPLMRLPTEIMVKILTLIPFRVRFPSLLLVNRAWYRAMGTIPELWSEIELRNTISGTSFQKLHAQVLAANSTRLFKRIERLNVKMRGTDEKSVLGSLLDRAKLQVVDLQLELRSLDLRDFFLTVYRSKLARHNVAALKSLSLECNIYVGFEHFIFQALPSLAKLQIVVQRFKQPMNALEMERKQEMLSKLPDDDSVVYPNLESLAVLSSVEQGRPLPFRDLLLKRRFPNLNQLTVSAFQTTDLDAFNIPTLRHLVLYATWHISAVEFLRFGPRLHLETLVLQEFRVTDPGLRLPAEVDLSHFKNLRTLDLGSSSIWYDDLVRLLSATDERVENLGISNCQNLVWPSSPLDMRGRNYRGRLVDFGEVLELCPNLVSLQVQRAVNLNNFTLKQMGETILQNFQHFKLESLWLGYNNISGHGLVDFFQLQSPGRIKVDKLVVLGNDIKTETLDLLVRKKFVTEVES